MAEIQIDEETYEKLKIRAEDKGFDSAEKYVKRLLKKIASKVEGSDEEKVKKRLESLGYMD